MVFIETVVPGLSTEGRGRAADIVEHSEVEALPQVFVRMRLGSDVEARVEGLNEVVNVIRRSAPIDIAHLEENTAASGDVVIVIAQPYDTVGSVLDQLTPFDSLWLAMNAGGGRSIDFFNIRGGRAAGEQDADATPVDPVKTRDVTLQEFLGSRHGASKQMVLA